MTSVNITTIAILLCNSFELIGKTMKFMNRKTGRQKIDRNGQHLINVKYSPPQNTPVSPDEQL